MAIERDIAEIKAMLLEHGELLRRLAGVRVAPDDEYTEYGTMEAARYCGVSRPTLVRYAKEVGIPEHRHEGRAFCYYLKSELDTIIRVKRLGKKANRTNN